jgi:hypothetical protein
MYISARIGFRTPRITAQTGAVASGMKYYYYYYYYPPSSSSDGESDGTLPAGSAPESSSAGSQALASASQPVGREVEMTSSTSMALAPSSAPAKIGKRGPGRPPSNKSAKGTAPKIPRRPREEEDEHADFRARLNNGSPIKRTREPIMQGDGGEGPELGMVLRSSQLNASGAARAAEHAEQQEVDLPSNPNNPLSRVSVNITERALGDAGLFRLPHNRRTDDIFRDGPGPITSSVRGLDSDPDYNPTRNDL